MAKFTKNDLVAALAATNTADVSNAAKRRQATADIDTIIDTIRTNVVAGNEVNVIGLCSFKPAVQPAKTGKVMGVTYSTSAKNVVRIYPSKPFSDAVEGA